MVANNTTFIIIRFATIIIIVFKHFFYLKLFIVQQYIQAS